MMDVSLGRAGHNEIPHHQPSVDCLMICVVRGQVDLTCAVMFMMMRRQTGDCIFSWLHHQHPARQRTSACWALGWLQPAIDKPRQNRHHHHLTVTTIASWSVR